MFLLRLWKNPTARRVILWVLPFVITFITKTLEESSAKQSAVDKSRPRKKV